MSRLYRTLAAMCLGGMFSGAAALAQEPRITTITPEKPVRQWVVEGATGRIFASLPEANAVVEYNPATGKEVRRLAIEGQPSQLVLKGHWLVAACPKSAALAVIDLKENKLSGRVPLPGRGLLDLFCSQVDNTYVYVLCDPNNRASSVGAPMGPSWGREVVQVRVDRKEVRRRVINNRWAQQNHLPVAMSGDGQRLLMCMFNNSVTFCNGLDEFDEETCAFQPVQANINPVQGYGAVVASGRWWIVGNCLFSSSLGQPVRTFAGSPVAVHPALDLAASLQGSQLMLQTFSAADTLKAIDLPEAPGDEESPPKPAEAEAVSVQYDLAGKRVVCGFASKAYVVGLSNLGATIAKRLEIVTTERTTVGIGQTLRVPLVTNAARGGPQPAWTLDSAPAWAKLQGSDLVLAPGAADLGVHEVVVKASQGDLSDTLTMSIHVELPSVNLGFTIRDVAVDRGQRGVIAWGPSLTVDRPADPSNEPMDFALIDLDAHKVVGTQSLPGGIRFAAADDKYVFVALTNPYVLYRFDRADLSKKRRIFLGGVPLGLAITPDKHVAVEINEGGGCLLRMLDPETLDSEDQGDADVTSHDNGRRSRHTAFHANRFGDLPLSEPVGDGAVRQLERILDLKTGEMRCLLSAGDLPNLMDFPSRGPNSFTPSPFSPYPNANPGGHQLWGRAIVNNSLTMAQGKPVATLPAGAKISPDDPLAAGIRFRWTGRGQETTLEFFNLVLGETIGSVDLGESRNDGGQSGLSFVKDTVLVSKGSRLLFCAIPPEVRKDLPMPLTLQYPRIGVASVDKPLAVQFVAVHGEGRPTFALAKKYEGLTLDAATGKVAIDLPAIWKRRLPSLSQPNLRSALDAQAAAMRSEFQRLTGRPLPQERFAFALPLEVAVSDAEGQQDRLQVAVIVLAPADDLGTPPEETPRHRKGHAKSA